MMCKAKIWIERLVSIANETDEWNREHRNYFYCVDDEESNNVTLGLKGNRDNITNMIFMAMEKSETAKECFFDAVNLYLVKRTRYELPENKKGIR